MLEWSDFLEENWEGQETVAAEIAGSFLGERGAERHGGRPPRRGGHLGEREGSNLVQSRVHKIHILENLGASVTQL